MNGHNQPRPQQKVVREVGLEGAQSRPAETIPTRPMWQAKAFLRRPLVAAPCYTFTVDGCLGEYTGQMHQLIGFELGANEPGPSACTCRECGNLVRSAWFVARAPGCHCLDCHYADSIAAYFEHLHRFLGYVATWRPVDLAPHHNRTH